MHQPELEAVTTIIVAWSLQGHRRIRGSFPFADFADLVRKPPPIASAASAIAKLESMSSSWNLAI
jgi:hypothetical protein